MFTTFSGHRNDSDGCFEQEVSQEEWTTEGLQSRVPRGSAAAVAGGHEAHPASRPGTGNPHRDALHLDAERAVKYAFIQAHATTWHVTTMCRVLEVSKAGYYKWRAEPFGLRKQSDAALLVHVRKQFYRLRGRYGSPRLCRELRALGHVCSEKRVARLMRMAGLRAKGAHRFVVTTNSAHAQPIAPNVLGRRFAVTEQPGLDRRWAADITYVPTREGGLECAA
jgi:hypothetical protein